MRSEAALEIRDLAVRFDDRWVLRDFNLLLHRGEKVTLAGPSGSGKSTVLKCVLGLVVPDRGTVRVFGQEADGHSVWALRRRLAYVSQEPDLGTGSVREVIERPFGYRANAGLRENLKRLPELLDRFLFPRDLLEKEISTLSGGEKQRIALIAAILLDRSIVLLDEASSALDRHNKKLVAGYFRDSHDLTVLSVSHDVEWMDFSSRVLEITRPSPEGAQ